MACQQLMATSPMSRNIACSRRLLESLQGPTHAKANSCKAGALLVTITHLFASRDHSEQNGSAKAALQVSISGLCHCLLL